MATIEDAEKIARHMASYATQPEVQTTQTQFRMQLVEGWQIPRGARVLEIGCGQGDMTAVLAAAVGSAGRVTAVDIALPDYGTPFTVGGSMRYLKETPIGASIDFHFQYDVLDDTRDFPAHSFDYVVLAHCSWYFESLDQLGRLFRRVRPWTKQLCYSEWDMEPRTIEQVGHLLAVLIQGQIETFKAESTRNVRTPFSRATLTELLSETGWTISAEATVDASLLQDAGWEISGCLASCAQEADALSIPVKAREFLDSQLDVLRATAVKGNVRPLPSYSVVAKAATGQQGVQALRPQ
jgi:SAM-dependent methyltransferase